MEQEIEYHKDMNATITTTKPVRNRYGVTKHGRHSVVYVNTPLNDVVDEFARAHGVFGLSFRSKTWTRLCKMVHKRTTQALEPLFKDVAQGFRFSHRAGCACGCSPGYIMTHVMGPRADHWVEVKCAPEELEEFRAQVFSTKVVGMLQQEILQQDTHQVA